MGKKKRPLKQLRAFHWAEIIGKPIPVFRCGVLPIPMRI